MFRRLIFLFLILSLSASYSIAQSCLPNGITFLTQGAVDSFSINYPGCTEIGGNVKTSSVVDITNLDGLANLTSVGGSLRLGYNDNLTDIDGLANLTSIGGDLSIASALGLTNLDGLVNLTSVGENVHIQQNSNLTNLDGLANLTSVGGRLFLANDYSLTDLDGFANLISVGGDLSILHNPILTDCCGIQELLSTPGAIGGSIDINGNPSPCSNEGEILASCSVSQTPFITTWKTDNPGTSNATSITISTYSGETYNYDVDWENDGVFDEFGITDSVTHDFGVAGTYTVAMRGEFPRMKLGGDKYKIIDIVQWGDIVWSSMNSAFKGATNLTISATDAPILSSVTDLSSMFEGASSFNGDLSNWNISNVTNLSKMFFQAKKFNSDLSNWKVDNVVDMSYLFFWAMDFNSSLSSWDFSQVQHINHMVNMSGLSRNSYDILLASLPHLQGVTFSAYGLEYCKSQAHRHDLINNFDWTISGDELDCGLHKAKAAFDHRTVEESGFLLYPNPANDVLKIGIASSIDIEHVYIYNVAGDLILSVGACDEIDISSLPKGFYNVKLATSKGTRFNRFIKI